MAIILDHLAINLDTEKINIVMAHLRWSTHKTPETSQHQHLLSKQIKTKVSYLVSYIEGKLPII